VIIDGWFELVLGAVVVEWSMEGEEAVVFPVDDVMKSGQFGAESFGEALPGKVGEIVQGFESPELEDFEVWQRKGSNERGCGEFQAEGM